MTANPNLFGNHYYREVSRARCLQQKLVNNKRSKIAPEISTVPARISCVKMAFPGCANYQGDLLVLQSPAPNGVACKHVYDP